MDIVLIGTVAWKVVHSVAEYTAHELARHHRVLFVEPFNSLPSLIREAKLQKRDRKRETGVKQVESNIWVYSPPPIGMFGSGRWNWANQLNGRIFAKMIEKAYRQIGFIDPVLWTYLYNSSPTLKRMKSPLKIYECGDEDSALARNEQHKQLVRERDKETCESVDIVFAVTEELAAPRRAINPKTYEVNCAADPTFFTQVSSSDNTRPDDIKHLKGPIIGYLGSLDPWKMDVNLLTTIARSHPEWNIVMVGYVWFGFDPAPLKQLPNIHVLGPKPYADLPKYVKCMDVCIMPFPLNDITRNGDALKCYEYLASGKPVVSTPVPVARRLHEVVKVADTPDAFVKAIQSCLEESPEVYSKKRAEVAQSHTWENRVKQKLEIIHAHLQRS